MTSIWSHNKVCSKRVSLRLNLFKHGIQLFWKRMHQTLCSTWASNELGGGNPQAAKMTLKIVMVLVVAEMVIIGMILFICRYVLGYAFSREKEVLDHDLSLNNYGWPISSTFRVTFSHVSHVMAIYLEQNFWICNLFIQGIPSTEHSFIIQFRIFSLEFRS